MVILSANKKGEPSTIRIGQPKPFGKKISFNKNEAGLRDPINEKISTELSLKISQKNGGT